MNPKILQENEQEEKAVAQTRSTAFSTSGTVEMLTNPKDEKRSIQSEGDNCSTIYKGISIQDQCFLKTGIGQVDTGGRLNYQSTESESNMINDGSNLTFLPTIISQFA